MREEASDCSRYSDGRLRIRAAEDSVDEPLLLTVRVIVTRWASCILMLRRLARDAGGELDSHPLEEGREGDREPGRRHEWHRHSHREDQVGDRATVQRVLDA